MRHFPQFTDAFEALGTLQSNGAVTQVQTVGLRRYMQFTEVNPNGVETLMSFGTPSGGSSPTRANRLLMMGVS